MSIRPLRVVFELDGTGVVYDPVEPIHLDGVMAWALAPFHATRACSRRGDVPEDIPLPLGRWQRAGEWGWSASALFPDGGTAEALQHWRKKFRVNRVEYTRGSPNLTQGYYREWNAPVPLTLTPRLVGYCVGDRKRVAQVLRRVKSLGKQRRMGKGRVISVTVDHWDDDWSVVQGNIAMRWLPRADGTRRVRCRPPYWNPVGAVMCGEVGEPTG